MTDRELEIAYSLAVHKSAELTKELDEATTMVDSFLDMHATLRQLVLAANMTAELRSKFLTVLDGGAPWAISEENPLDDRTTCVA